MEYPENQRIQTQYPDDNLLQCMNDCLERNLWYLSLIATVMSCLLVADPGNPFWNRDVKKAKEFMQVDMYGDAIQLLNTIINQKSEPIQRPIICLAPTICIPKKTIRVRKHGFSSAVN